MYPYSKIKSRELQQLIKGKKPFYLDLNLNNLGKVLYHGINPYG